MTVQRVFIANSQNYGAAILRDYNRELTNVHSIFKGETLTVQQTDGLKIDESGPILRVLFLARVGLIFKSSRSVTGLLKPSQILWSCVQGLEFRQYERVDTFYLRTASLASVNQNTLISDVICWG